MLIRPHATRLKISVRLFVSSLWLLGLMSAVAQAQDFTKNTNELNELRNKINKIKSALENDIGERDRERDELRDVEKHLITLNQKQHKTDNEIKAVENEIAQLHGRHDALKKESQQLVDGIADLARATYMMGRQEYIKLLLQQQQPEKVNRALVYYRYLAESRVQRVRQVNTNAQEMSRLAALAQTRSDELKNLQTQLEVQTQQAEQLRAQREQQLAAIQSKINDRTKEVDRLRADERRLAELLSVLQRESQKRRELARKQERERQRKAEQAKKQNQVQQKPRKTIAKITPTPAKGGRFSQMKGRLPLPVNAPISTQFGQINHESGMTWDGIWFSAPENADVRAIYEGHVSYADWFRGFGLLLIIDHGNGYMSLYSHNKELYKSLGDPVGTGEVIGSVGSTGGLPKPGLYFEIRENGQPRNPLIWCRAS